ncbi:MAG: hypothetical protein M0Z41_05245 [Peptococcaceae bacterium]|nr:hypothetical protein [Peptococcaceae bacterium]
MKRTGPQTVLLATGHQRLDAELAVQPSLRVLGQVLYREAVAEKADRSGAETVVLACSLPGGMDLAQVIYDLRRQDRRIILLAGNREGADGGLLGQAVGLGVYDLLFDPVRPEEVARSALEPAGFACAAAWLAGSGEQVVRPAPDGMVRKATPRSGPPTSPPDHPSPRYEQTDHDGSGPVLAEAEAVYRVPAPNVPARLIVFASPRAGVGRSFLAAALGIWLAGQGEAAAMVDLDGGRARFRWSFGRQGRGGGLFNHPSGLEIAREGAGSPVQTVNELAAVFRTVIVTLPAAGREGTPDVLAGAARIFLVATPERGVLYDVMRDLYHYRHLGLDPGNVQLVLNRLGHNAKIGLGEVGGLMPPALCTIVPESGSTPEEALRGRRFRRCMEDLGRSVGAGGS